MLLMIIRGDTERFDALALTTSRRGISAQLWDLIKLEPHQLGGMISTASASLPYTGNLCSSGDPSSGPSPSIQIIQSVMDITIGSEGHSQSMVA